MSNPKPQIEPELDDIECEIADLVEEYGSERAALRASLIDRRALLVEGNACVSRGFLRGWFSEGARPVREPE